jgi:hypothetical protein
MLLSSHLLTFATFYILPYQIATVFAASDESDNASDEDGLFVY